MSQSNQTFKAADLSKKFKAACIQFDTLLASANSKELATIRQKFRDGLRDYKQQGALTVAFVGQYSAGKSTIISALTGRRDIHIDADIATDATTPYDWNGIKIIDTPGLFTDRADHDDITYEAIAKADLLVFCLTHMLFDTLTVENFKKLAYDKGYRWKIMLVVNKMSAAGEEEQKIASYRQSLSAALKPYALNEFPICFIDAKDYCEGIDDDDDFLVEISRFDTFITELNHFVERRASLTRLDTPVRIVLGCLDDAQIGFARNSDEDTAFLEVLSRLSRRINKERERLRTKIKGITLEMSAAIATEGSNLATAIGTQDYEDLARQTEKNIETIYEKAGDSLENEINHAVDLMQAEIANELQSNLTQAFIAHLECNPEIHLRESEDKNETQGIKQQIDFFAKMASQTGGKLSSSATRSFFKTADGSQRFLRSMDVAGGELHRAVYSIGKFIGFKFKPFQAVNIAKNVGNAAKLIGPIAAVITIALEGHTMYQEHKDEQDLADKRRKINSQIKSFVIDLEKQILGQLQEFEFQVYAQLEKNIAEARQQTESAMAASHTEIGQIVAIRKELETIILEIQHTAASTVL